MCSIIRGSLFIFIKFNDFSTIICCFLHIFSLLECWQSLWMQSVRKARRNGESINYILVLGENGKRNVITKINILILLNNPIFYTFIYKLSKCVIVLSYQAEIPLWQVCKIAVVRDKAIFDKASYFISICTLSWRYSNTYNNSAIMYLTNKPVIFFATF